MSKSSALSKSAGQPQENAAFDAASSEAGTPQWKQEVNQRLAAHRNRRGGSQEAADSRVASPRAASAKAAEAAAKVAARYAKAPSYSQLLAGEARAVVRAAGAAAEAARHAQAAAQAVLEGLESNSGPTSDDFWDTEPRAVAQERVQAAAPVPAAPARWQDEPPAALEAYVAAPEDKWAGAQPRWEETLPAAEPDIWSEMRLHPSPYSDGYVEAGQRGSREGGGRSSGRGNGYSVDEGELFPEDSFDAQDSYDPMGKATVHPLEHLPANLIEFPRELVATRKARPRLAEGPFYNASHADSQLSIFEVDPELLPAPIAMHAPAAAEIAPPEWASIELEHLEPYAPAAEVAPMESLSVLSVYGGQTAAEQIYAAVQTEPVAYAGAAEAASASGATETMAATMDAPARAVRGRAASDAEYVRSEVSRPVEAPAVELLVAPMSDRLLAAVVDGALVTLACVAAAVVVTASTAHPPTGRTALIASGIAWVIFGLLYQFLFMSYAEEGTPGMRYARIALCTFTDDNPTLEQMRMRIPALLVAALPAGLGLLWAMFDKEHLGWHDRLTKTYQRKY